MRIHGLVPMLETEDLPRTIAFYRDVLGFEVRGLYPDEENACWASLQNGPHEIAFSGKDPNAIAGTVMTGALYMYVEDLDAVWADIKEQVEVMFEPVNMAYNMREFGFRDNNGYALILGQDISQKTQEG